jgi:hypothetical protein
MAAAGYVTYAGSGANGDRSAASARYRLSPEQAEAFTNPDSPGYIAGAFPNLTAATRVVDRLTEAFRTGAVIGWHEQHEDMFEGTERFFRPGYLANLTSSWIPSLADSEKRLADGARVAATRDFPRRGSRRPPISTSFTSCGPEQRTSQAHN